MPGVTNGYLAIELGSEPDGGRRPRRKRGDRRARSSRHPGPQRVAGADPTRPAGDGGQPGRRRAGCRGDHVPRPDRSWHRFDEADRYAAVARLPVAPRTGPGDRVCRSTSTPQGAGWRSPNCGAARQPGGRQRSSRSQRWCSAMTSMARCRGQWSPGAGPDRKPRSVRTSDRRAGRHDLCVWGDRMSDCVRRSERDRGQYRSRRSPNAVGDRGADRNHGRVVLAHRSRRCWT